VGCGAVLGSKVAVVTFGENDVQESFGRALRLVGGIGDINTAKRNVVIKVGVFDPCAGSHTSVNVTDAIARSFGRAPKVFLVESDNYRGKALERLQIWKQVFSSRLVPFSLSDDMETRKLRVADEELGFSHVLFKPNVFVSTHVLRSYERGSVLKNLLGLVPDSKKARFHKKLDRLLADVYEGIDGIDLAVLDGTYLHGGGSTNLHVKGSKAGVDRARTNALVVGRDAVAVETVGAVLAGLQPERMSVIREFVRRGLGEGDLRNIDVVGDSFEDVKENFAHLLKLQKRQRPGGAPPQTWGGQAHGAMKNLTLEGFFKLPNKRTRTDVAKAFEAKGVSTRGKEDNISRILALRVKRGVLKTENGQNGRVYWTE
jgi:uncharacterized protein (DUF362 family)